VYAQNNDPATFRDDLSVMGPLLAASHERMRDDGSEPGRNELRSAAAFTLGVIGGDAALNRLRYLLGDSFPNVRYNAATALCRHGDVSALPVLLEMLDPESAACRAADSAKRVLVLTNGIRAASELAEKNATAGLEPLLGALRKIADGELAQFPSRVRREIHIHAKKSLRLIGGKSIALDSR
jgi:HEAT repeat protein